MEIGSFCEAKWSAISEAAAWSEYESQPYIVDIREEQRRLSAIPVKLRIDPNSSPDGKSSELLTVAERIDEVSHGIDAVLESESASRYSSTPVRRPQGAKKDILEEVAESKKITKRMVKKCWDEFRSVQERLKLELS